MRYSGLIGQTIFYTLLGLVLVASIIYFFTRSMESTTDEVLQTGIVHSERASNSLIDAWHQIDKHFENLFAMPDFSEHLGARRVLDSTASHITDSVLTHFIGLEGGFYSVEGDFFFGYAKPAGNGPKPIVGPPTDIHRYVLDLCKSSLQKEATPRFFYKTENSEYVIIARKVRNTPEIVVWVAMRMDPLLPEREFDKIVKVVSVLALFGIVFAIIISWLLRKRVEYILLGLQKLKTDDSFTFPKISGILGLIASDINGMIEARKISERNHELISKQLQQHNKLEALGKLVAGVSHEVKTPLTIIKTRIQMWQRKLKNQTAEQVITAESLDLVIEEIDRLTSLVNRLLAFSKPKLNEFSAESLNRVLLHTIEILKPEFEKRNVNFSLVLTESYDNILCDKGSLSQVFMIIINNALEAMKSNPSLTITSETNNTNEIIVSIYDNGPGISTEIAENIFDPFFTTKEKGTGLGLSIAHELISAHSGSIVLKNNADKGAVCQITFKTIADSSINE